MTPVATASAAMPGYLNPRKSEAVNPFKYRDHIIVKGVDTRNPDHEGYVSNVEGEYVYVTNTNMPYCGTMCGEKFHYTELELR